MLEFAFVAEDALGDLKSFCFRYERPTERNVFARTKSINTPKIWIPKCPDMLSPYSPVKGTQNASIKVSAVELPLEATVGAIAAKWRFILPFHTFAVPIEPLSNLAQNAVRPTKGFEGQ
jgi:hypothetical protein